MIVMDDHFPNSAAVLAAVLEECASSQIKAKQMLHQWLTEKIRSEGFAWVSKIENQAVDAGVFADTERQQVPKQGSGGAGTRISYGPGVVETFFYLLEGKREDVSVKDIARARRAGLVWEMLGAMKEVKANQFQAMRPILLLLNTCRLPNDIYSSFWRTPQKRGETEIPSEFIRAVRDGETWDLYYRKKEYREYFPVSLVLEPQRSEEEYLLGVTKHSDFCQERELFSNFVNALFDNRSWDARKKVVVPSGAVKFVVDGYTVDEFGGVFQPKRPTMTGEALHRRMTLLEHVWTHVRALVLTEMLDENLGRCVNVKCKAPFFFPWRHRDFCENANCRKAVSHNRVARRQSSSLGEK